MTDEWPAMRAAAVRATAAIDPESFPLVAVRAGARSALDRPRPRIADVLGDDSPEIAIDRLRAMLDDQDKRVVPSVIAALARLKAPDIEPMLLAQLKAPDSAIRAAAARALGELKPPGGAGGPARAIGPRSRTRPDDAREAALTALAAYGAAEAIETLKTALRTRTGRCG